MMQMCGPFLHRFNGSVANVGGVRQMGTPAEDLSVKGEEFVSEREKSHWRW